MKSVITPHKMVGWIITRKRKGVRTGISYAVDQSYDDADPIHFVYLSEVEALGDTKKGDVILRAIIPTGAQLDIEKGSQTGWTNRLTIPTVYD